MQRFVIVSIAHVGDTTLYMDVWSAHVETRSYITGAFVSRGDHGDELRVILDGGYSLSFASPRVAEWMRRFQHELWVYRDETWHVWGRFPITVE